MSPISDGYVGVRQAASPDRLIDNEILTIAGETVYRQRVQDPEALVLLAAVQAAIEGTIAVSVSGEVSLSAATLAALETINAVVTGAVTVSGTVALDSTSLSALETIELGATTLAALENITATISGAVALDSATLAALESISATIINTVTVTGTVELGSASLAALESITTTVSNFPADYPDVASLAKLEAIRLAVDELEGFTDEIESALALLATDVGQEVAVARLTSILAAIAGLEAITGGLATQATAAAILAVLTSAVPVTGTINVGNFPTPPIPLDEISIVGQVLVAALDLDIRSLTLTEDSVRQAHRTMTPFSSLKTGPLTAHVLVPAGAAERIRVLKNSGHCDPETGTGVYPVITMKIGSTIIYTDKLESGLPWNETVCFEGALGEDLTLDLTTSTVYLNVRYELF